VQVLKFIYNEAPLVSILHRLGLLELVRAAITHPKLKRFVNSKKKPRYPSGASLSGRYAQAV
jgi:hypothetical protein